MAARARSVPQERSNGLLEPPLNAPGALEGAVRAPSGCLRDLENTANYRTAAAGGVKMAA